MHAPTIPGYEIRRRLGRGGMGEVWLGMRPNIAGIAKPVAIKVVHLDPHAPNPERAFLEEVRVSTVLNHSNLVQVFDVGAVGELGYLVMEVVDGVDLSQLIGTLASAGEGVSQRAAVYIVAQVLRALDYAHSLRLDGHALEIVHRDISPHNILISVSGEVKLLDFGIARSRLDATTGHSIKGKLRYMAPEQFAGQPLDGRADLYAVGVVLHELVSGQPFRIGQTPPELYAELADAAIPPLRVAVHPAVEAVRVGLLQRDPTHRFADAASALRALEGSPFPRGNGRGSVRATSETWIRSGRSNAAGTSSHCGGSRPQTSRTRHCSGRATGRCGSACIQSGHATPAVHRSCWRSSSSSRRPGHDENLHL